jgi:hypothetical protein
MLPSSLVVQLLETKFLSHGIHSLQQGKACLQTVYAEKHGSSTASNTHLLRCSVQLYGKHDDLV